jgi:hypothetical protein
MVVLFSGCVTRLYVKFGNATTENVVVKSTETGKEVEVSPGRFKKFLHSSGDLVVKTEAKREFKFEGIKPAFIEPPYRGGSNVLPGPGRVVLNLQLQTNMQLHVLLPGKKTVDDTIQQPKGYPKSGKEETR